MQIRRLKADALHDAVFLQRIALDKRCRQRLPLFGRELRQGLLQKLLAFQLSDTIVITDGISCQRSFVFVVQRYACGDRRISDDFLQQHIMHALLDKPRQQAVIIALVAVDELQKDLPRYIYGVFAEYGGDIGAARFFDN